MREARLSLLEAPDFLTVRNYCSGNPGNPGLYLQQMQPGCFFWQNQVLLSYRGYLFHAKASLFVRFGHNEGRCCNGLKGSYKKPISTMENLQLWTWIYTNSCSGVASKMLDRADQPLNDRLVFVCHFLCSVLPGHFAWAHDRRASQRNTFQHSTSSRTILFADIFILKDIYLTIFFILWPKN